MLARTKDRAPGRETYSAAMTIMAASGLLKFPYLCKPDAERADTWIIAGQLVLTRGEHDTISLTDPITGAGPDSCSQLRDIAKMGFLAPIRSEQLAMILRHVTSTSAATAADLEAATTKLVQTLPSTIPYQRQTAEYFVRRARAEKWIALASRGKSTLRAALWQIADDAKLRLTFRLFGHTATIAHYNFVASNWNQTRENDPRPITLGDLAATHFAALKVTADTIFRPGASISFSQSESRTFAADPLTLRNKAEGIPALLRTSGFSPRVWRSITRAKPRGSVAIMRAAISTITLNESPNTLNALALLAPETLPASTIKPLIKIIAHNNESVARAVAAEIRRRARKRTIRSFIPELDGMVDMLSNLKCDRRILPSNITWTGLKALSDSWHEWSIHSRTSTTFYRWLPLLGDLQLDQITVTEITDSDALSQEGRAMHHCVGGYDRACASGETRMFHLAPEAGNPSTLELRFDRERKRWEIGQHYSYCNKPAGKANLAAGVTVLRRANRSGLFDASTPPDAERTKRVPSEDAAPNPLHRYPQAKIAPSPIFGDPRQMLRNISATEAEPVDF